MASPLRSQIKDAIILLATQVEFPSPVNGYSTWVTGPSRRLMMFNKIDPSAQPACFLVQHREGYDARGAGLPPRRRLYCGLWCFAPSGGESVVGDDLLDSMQEGIEAVFNRPDDVMRNELTLGGLCYYCKLDAASNLFVRDPGDIDGQALLIMPMVVLMP